MNVRPRPPVRHGPPPRRATAGDTLFALGIAALALAFAGLLLAATGGAPWQDRRSTAAVATPTPTASGPIVAPTPRPRTSAEPSPTAAASPTATPTAGPPSARPTPAAGPFTMNLYRKGVFVHQVDKDACVAAAVQNTLNVIRLREDGRKPDLTGATQRSLYDRIVELTTRKDSRNGGTGPGGWAAILTEEGYPYELQVHETRADALRAAAKALRATNRPVGILAWAGVHSWVMTGFRATADPASGRYFSVTTAYVLDPWYPWVSDLWPRSEAPNAPRDDADLKANIRPWKLGSGPYPGRDGRYLIVAPVDV